jgi:hypothetical protein
LSTSAELLERLRAARLHQQRSSPDLDTLVRHSIGLHSTDYATPYLSARARVGDFEPAPLFARLSRGDGLVRVNAMRGTVHVVHVHDLPLIVAACGRRPAELKALSDRELAAGVAALCEVLQDGPLGNHELKAALPSHAPTLRAWLLAAMAQGEVIRADGPHARSNRTRYALTRQWVAGYEPSELPAPEARRLLLLRAVHTFGPLTVDDLAWWLPAPKREVTAALVSDRELEHTEVEGVTYWFGAALASVSAPPRDGHGAWFLPYEDALLKAYLDRGWCLAPGLQKVIFPMRLGHWAPPDGADPGPGPWPGPNATGEARPSIWWGGRVVGRWEEGESSVQWQLHADVGAEGKAEIGASAAQLAKFLKDSGLQARVERQGTQTLESPAEPSTPPSTAVTIAR